MKQVTAVEWLVQQTPNMHWEDAYWADLFEQAKEMEKQQQDEFAIGFAKWLLTNCWLHDDAYWELVTKSGDVQKSEKELLEIYKKEKGL